MFQRADAFSLASFLFLVVGVIIAVLMGIVRSESNPKRAKYNATNFLLGFGVWLVALGFIVASGLIEAHPVPLLFLFFALSNLAGILFAFSRMGKRLSSLPFSYLVGFHGFRLILEFVLHLWALQGVIPTTMSWGGSNFDVIGGALACVLAPFAHKTKIVPWAFNLIGLGLLMNVMRVAILSSPFSFGWHTYPPLQLAFHIPYFLIVPVFVAGALAGHLVLTRKLTNI